MKSKEYSASKTLVFTVKNNKTGDERLIITPISRNTNEVEDNLLEDEYIDMCNTALGYFNEDITLVI